jgi:hypothetical protein
MARTKQLSHHDITAAANAMTVSDESESSDDIVVETMSTKASQQPKGKKNTVAVEPAKRSTVNQTTKTTNGTVKNTKGKGKAKVGAEADDQDMEVDIENLTGKKWPEHALVGPPSRDINVLKRDNDIVCPFVQAYLKISLTCSPRPNHAPFLQLEEENQRLQQALDNVLEAVEPSIREEEMQAEIEALNELIKRDYFHCVLNLRVTTTSTHSPILFL